MNDGRGFGVFKNYDPTKDLSQAPSYITKNGAAKPLLASEIKEAQSKARSAAEAARILGVSYNTYKKYAREYGIFEDLKNPDGVGISKGANYIKGPVPLEEIFEGKHPNYPHWKLKKRLLKSGYLEEKCANCGFDERRITDYKVPLLLDYIDEDKTNLKYENLQVICFNCAYLIRGNLTGPKKLFDY
jgi:hypothetical protein